MRDLLPFNGRGLRKDNRTAQRGTRLLALSFALGACGSEKQEEPKRASPEKAYATFIDLYADMVCGPVARCCNELNQAIYTLGSGEPCRDTVELTAGVEFVGALGAIGAGTATYHEERQRACAAALEAASCEELTAGTPDACLEPWFDGTVPLGQSCDTSWECIDSYCLRPASARRAEKELIHLLLPPYPDVPSGQCVVPLPAGADCTGDLECDSGSCKDGACEQAPSVLDAMCPI